MIPKLSIEDVDGNVYTFPASFFITTDPFSVRSSIKDLIYAHGGRETADKFIGSRRLSIEGELQKDSGSLFETEYRKLIKAIMKGGKLRVTTDVVSRFMDVATPLIDSEWEYYPQYKKINITFNVQFPFWQDYTETTYTKVTAGNDLLVPDLSGSDSIVLPIIEIKADQGASIPGIVLRNTTDGGMIFEYNNIAFVSGALLTIDSSEGTITLNSNPAMESIVQGSFVRLQPKINNLYYEGNAATIRVKYRNIYL